MISRLRKQSDKIAPILAWLFVALKIHPTIVSFLAIPFAFVFMFLVWQYNFVPAFFVGIIAFLIDLVDGNVARKLGKASPFGNYIDAVIDKTVDFIVIASFVFLFPLATVLVLGTSFLVSYAKPRVGLVIMTDNRHWPGIGERGDKMALLLLGLLVSAFVPKIFGFWTMELTLYIVSAISIIGLFQRILYGKKLIEEAKKKGTILPYLRKKHQASEKNNA